MLKHTHLLSIIVLLVFVPLNFVEAKLPAVPHLGVINPEGKSVEGEGEFKTLLQTATKSSGVSGATLVGTYYVDFYTLGHVLQQSSTEERVATYTITFSTPFNKIPTVALALTYFDISNDYIGVRVYADKITRSDFVLRIVAPPDVKIYKIEVSWLATISAWSGIYASTVCWYDYCDQDVRDAATTVSERKFYKSVSHPATLSNPKVVLAVNGFSFNTGSNFNTRLFLDVAALTSSEVKILMQTWGDSKFYGAGITVLHYDDTAYQGNAQIESTVGGVLNSGTGERSESKTATSEINNPLVWPSFYYFDIQGSSVNRLSIQATTSDTTITGTFKAYLDSKIYHAKANLFYTNA